MDSAGKDGRREKEVGRSTAFDRGAVRLTRSLYDQVRGGCEKAHRAALSAAGRSARDIRARQTGMEGDCGRANASRIEQLKSPTFSKSSFLSNQSRVRRGATAVSGESVIL